MSSGMLRDMATWFTKKAVEAWRASMIYVKSGGKEAAKSDCLEILWFDILLCNTPELSQVCRELTC